MATLIEKEVSLTVKLTEEECYALHELLAYTAYPNPLYNLSDIVDEVTGEDLRDGWKLGSGRGGLLDRGLVFIPEEK